MERKKQMNYIYDILVNFNDGDRLIEFFEWNETDLFEHIKKIPIYRISSKQMQEICNNKIILDKEHLMCIKSKTQLYNNTDIKYALIVTDLNKAIALEFNDRGEVISRSSFLLDEEESIIEEACNFKEELLKYKLGDEYKIDYYLTRKELFKKNYLLKELNFLEKNKDYEKLNYLYEEIFKKDNLTYKERILRLIENIKNNYNFKHNELYEIIRLTYTKK